MPVELSGVVTERGWPPPCGIEKDTDDGGRGHETEGQMEKKQANGRIGTRFRGFPFNRIGNTWEALYYLFPLPRADERRELGVRRHLRRLGFMALGRALVISFPNPHVTFGMYLSKGRNSYLERDCLRRSS